MVELVLPTLTARQWEQLVTSTDTRRCYKYIPDEAKHNVLNTILYFRRISFENRH